MVNINQNKSIITLTGNGIILQSETVRLDKTVKNQLYTAYNNITLYFLNSYYFERECKFMRRNRQRRRQNPVLSAQSPKQGSISQTERL